MNPSNELTRLLFSVTAMSEADKKKAYAAIQASIIKSKS